MNKFKIEKKASKDKKEVNAQNYTRLKSANITTKKMNYSSKNQKQYNLKKLNDYLYGDFIEKKNMKMKNEKKQNINKNIKIRNMSSKINKTNINKNNNNKINNKNIKIRNMSINMNNNKNMNNNNINKNIYTKNLDKIFINNNKNLNSNEYNLNINRYNIKSSNELLIKKRHDLNELIKNNIKINQKVKEKEKFVKKNSRLEIAFKFEEKEKIDDIIELSNKRLGIKIRNKFKIYSLKTFKLITIIEDNDVNNKYLELENKDLVRKSFSFIQFFKLSGNEYYLFQTIDENNKINALIKLMKGNLLLSCNDKSINIYGKEENEYKLLSQNCDEKDCKDAIEIEDNKVVIFKEYYDEDDKGKYLIFFYDILNKNKKILMDDFYSSGEVGREYLNMTKNEKYLFVNFNTYSLSYNCYNWVKQNYIYDKVNQCKIIQRTNPISFIPPQYPNIGYIFNLGKENYLKCEYDIFPDKSGEEQGYKYRKYEISSNKNNSMMVEVNDRDKLLLEFKNFQFIFEKFPMKFEENYFKIVNLKNNNFIFYLDNKMILIKVN